MTAPPELAITARSPGGRVRDTGGSATKSARTNWNCSGVRSVTVDMDLNASTGTHSGAASLNHLSNTPASCACAPDPVKSAAANAAPNHAFFMTPSFWAAQDAQREFDDAKPILSNPTAPPVTPAPRAGLGPARDLRSA